MSEQSNILDTMSRSLQFLHILETLINPEGHLEAEQRGQLAWLLEGLLDDVQAGITLLEQRPCACRKGGRP